MSSSTVACGGTSTSTEQYRCAPFVTSTSTFPELLSVIRRSGAICPPRCRHRCIAISVVPANADALVNDRIRLVSREPDLAGFLAACASGQKLRERGFGQDVELAAQLDVSWTVPRLDCEAFQSWAP